MTRIASQIWSHKRPLPNVLFLISLPETKEFLQEASLVDNTINQLKKLGVDVYTQIDSQVLSKMTNYNYVIVVAHHDELTDSLILRDCSLSIADFVSYIPEEFSGVLDFSTCYSAGAMSRIKDRTHNRCKVQTSVKRTTLALRLIMYPHIIKLLLNEKDIDYGYAYSQVLDALTLSLPNTQEENKNTNQATKLGEKVSTIYAPSQVKKNQQFLVNIFFHKEEESETIALLAQRIDPKTSLVETQIIPITLKVKDTLTARLSIVGVDNREININNGIDTKSIIWLNRPAKIQFPLTVNDEFLGESFVCEIKLEANSEPIGECMFVISISDTESQVPCSITLTPHNRAIEHNSAKTHLKNLIIQNLNHIEKELESVGCETERNRLKAYYAIGKKCLNIIDNAKIRNSNDSIKKVFISSTSDMAPYRDIVKNEILSCGMFPVDYRVWYQANNLPCDICCQEVLESDVILCIIGAKYGSEEPSIGISMTQLEFVTALVAGLKILTYIINPLGETNEDELAKLKQLEFIEYIKKKRITKDFSDIHTLEKDTIRELSRLN